MNVLITGASRGIGYQTVKHFLKEGHNVMAISRNLKSLQELENLGAKVMAFDLLNESYQPIVDQIKALSSVDILINNAGLLVNKAFSELSNQDLKRVYGVNVFSIIKLTRDLLPYFSKHAHIINISSVGGVQGSVKFAGLSAYSSSKGAVSILTECLAEEFKETSVNFNCLCLGSVQTEMLEEAFPGYQAPISPKEMANYFLNFISQKPSVYKGKVIPVSVNTP